MKLERTMTTSQVADALGISRAAILVHANKTENPLPSIKVGAHYRFFPSDIIKYFKIPKDKLITSPPVQQENFNPDQEI